MKRTIPLLITALGGFVLIVSFFIPGFQRAGEEAAIWFDILAAIAFILGGANLFKLQLQKISDRNAGWGYSVVTLACFISTLGFGLLKFGCPPEPSVEAYGESTVLIPLSALPTFRLPVTSPPTRGDGAALPKSVHQQLSVVRGPDGDELAFQGWMQPNQQADLAAYQDTLEWRCQIERLAELAQPPARLAGKVRYDAGHGTLAFRGRLSDEDRDALLEVLAPSSETTQAVDLLMQLSRQTTSIRVANVPPGFTIPADQQQVVERTSISTDADGSIEQLTVHGPMTVRLRDDIAIRWANAPRVRPLLPNQTETLLQAIEQRGAPLSPAQRTAFDKFFAADWKPELLVQSLNTAGIGVPEPKAACELLAEIQTGTIDPELTRPAPPSVELNDGQLAAIENFMITPELTSEQLKDQLVVDGEFTAAQAAAFTAFFDQLPTQADQRKGLCFRLLAAGKLSREQRTFLLSGARAQFRWRQQIGELFLSSHRVKFPWSGDYSAQGSPFWWLYEYVMQPLLTTTFAVLAFYVASAAFRAFRAKNLEAILLLGTAFIILLGRTSAGPALTGWIPDRFSAFRMDQMTVYIMSIFNTAGNRAIMIGIALGTVSTSLKVLLGIDRSYLGKGDD